MIVPKLKYFLYLHGFKGSPNSEKAKKMRCYLSKTYQNCIFDAPDLNNKTVDLVLQLLLTNITQHHRNYSVNIIGSSLGGYIAHLLKQICKEVRKVILINPVIRLDLIIGDIECNQLKSQASKLLSMMPDKINNLKDYLILLQRDDQVIPIKHALNLFSNKTFIDIKNGQGHSYNNIEKSFSIISNFLN